MKEEVLKGRQTRNGGGLMRYLRIWKALISWHLHAWRCSKPRPHAAVCGINRPCLVLFASR